MLLQRLADAARQQPRVHAAVMVARRVQARASDRVLGIATDPYDLCPWLKHEHGAYTCDPIDYSLARRLVRAINLQPHDVMYDLGCGMGRMVCLAARYPVARCVGVEISEAFVEAAAINAQRLRGRCSPIEIVHADATALDYADGTVFFLCNPFGEGTMRQVLARIERSLTICPRDVRMVYANPMHEDLLEGCGWLERYDAYHSAFHERPSSFWRSVGTATGHAPSQTDSMLEVAASASVMAYESCPRAPEDGAARAAAASAIA